MIENLLTIIFYLSFVSFITGAIGVLPLGIPSVNVYLSDLAVGVLVILWFIKYKEALKIFQKDKKIIFFGIFIAIGFLSLLISPIQMSFQERLISSGYLARLFFYSFVYITTEYLFKAQNIKSGNIYKLLIFSGAILAVLGWMQYFLYPDLRNLYYLGWDPHYKRIFSTFLDPNFFGLIMVLVFIVVWIKTKISFWTVFLRLFIFTTIMFTYSRGTFVALVSAFLYYALSKRKMKIFALAAAVVLLSILLLPRGAGGVGVQLERTFSINDRISNWKETVTIISRYPIAGVGFNSLRYARRQFGFVTSDWLESHAAAGADNSLLFVLATTGIVGFLFFALFLFYCFKETGITGRVSLVVILVHSLFINSFFYPSVIFWLWIILSLGRNKKVKGYR